MSPDIHGCDGNVCVFGIVWPYRRQNLFMTELRQRQPRLLDAGFLAFLRTKPCACGCGRAAPSEAAHIRIGLFAGQMKPHDRDALPLNRWCHREAPDSQHADEKSFWNSRSLDPFKIAAALYQEYGGTGGKPRKPRTIIRPRIPKDKRQKIPARKAPWPKRKFSR
jgi:hypothetical protein